MVERKEALFDKLATVYDDWYKTPLGSFADKVEGDLIFKHLKEISKKKLLDVGCGTGLYSMRASIAGANVSGIDISEKMLEIAEKKAKMLSLPINFTYGDMENLPFAENTFDIVLSVTALEFSKNPLKALKEIHKVLKPKGKAVIGVLSAISIWAKKRKEKAKKTNSVYVYTHFFKPQELSSLMAKAGFRSIVAESSLFVPPNDEAKLPKFAYLQEFLGKFFTPLRGAFLAVTGGKIETY